MSNIQYDVAIIGGGPGGYVAAIRSAQLGKKTVVIERAKLGGVCLNWGCIPTKALLKNAEYMHFLNHASEFGFNIPNVEVDFPKVIARSREVAKTNSDGIDYLMKKNKVDVVYGNAELQDKNTILVNTKEGSSTISATNIIIATGARPRMFPNIAVDGKHIITSTEAMILPNPPKSMIIIGAGAIGIEFAYFFNAFGAKVTVVEMKPTILPVEDEECSKELSRAFKKKKVELLTETKVVTAKSNGSGVDVLIEDKKGVQKTITADIALNAVGVQGNIENLGLEKVGITVERGWIKVDKFMQTNIKNVYAIGDVAGPPWLAHKASGEGIVAAEHIAGNNPHGVDYTNIPGCTYCQPQVASVGLTEAKAKELGYELKIGRFPFKASGKARAIGETDGFVKLVIDAKYGEILGAHIVGVEATEMIAELGLARSLEATVESVLHTMHAHPTLSEAIMEAAADALGEAIHI